MKPRWTLTSIACLAMLSATVEQDSRPAAGAAAPVFRSTVNLVLVDVVVRDRKGAACPA